jgi:hypothetical protein
MTARAFSTENKRVKLLRAIRRMPYLYPALLTLAHLNRCAAAIFLRAATDIVLFGFGAWPLAFAHRAF